MFQCLVFFLLFAFSCLSFSYFPPLFDFLKPKSGPSDEGIGRNRCLSTRRKQHFELFGEKEDLREKAKKKKQSGQNRLDF